MLPTRYPPLPAPDRGYCAEGRNVFAIETCWWGVRYSIVVRLMESDSTISTEDRGITGMTISKEETKLPELERAIEGWQENE